MLKTAAIIISAKESCLYGIIYIRITPFLSVGRWFLDNSILPYLVRSYSFL